MARRPPRLLLCWQVVIRHRRRSERLGFFVSKPMTLTDAWALHAEYAATGHRVSIRCLEDVCALHRAVIAGHLSFDEAVEAAERLGHDQRVPV